MSDLAGPIELLWSNDELFAVNKPRFIHSVAGAGVSVEDLIDNVPGVPKLPHLTSINRLDYETSGILLFAVDKSHAERWRDEYNKLCVEKTYLALVEGCLSQDISISGYSGSPYRRAKKVRFSKYQQKRFIYSKSQLEPLAYSSEKDVTIVRLSTQYGRRHQVRLHCSTLGFPLVGDTLYGGSTFGKQEGFFLHAHTLRSQIIELTAPVFTDFLAVIDELRIPKPNKDIWNFKRKC